MDTTTQPTTQSSGHEDIADSLRELGKRNPSLANILDAFGPLARANAETLDKLADWHGFTLPTPDPARFLEGVPLLNDMEVPDFSAPESGEPDRFTDSLRAVAAAASESMPSVARDIDAALVVLNKRSAARELPHALWKEDGPGIEALTAGEDDPRETAAMLSFLGSLALVPFMQRIERQAAESIKDLQWKKGYCPICGCFPDMSLLKKKPLLDSEYLAAHGGQRWLHCSCCDHVWRFRRNVCPWCENEDHNQLHYLQDKKWKAERVDTCDKCKHYYVTLDTRELAKAPDTRVAPLGLVHLDIIAQEKGYQPLAETPWNRL
jgi:FdhE protein